MKIYARANGNDVIELCVLRGGVPVATFEAGEWSNEELAIELVIDGWQELATSELQRTCHLFGVECTVVEEQGDGYYYSHRKVA